MQIRSITVGAQRKVPHPSIDYASFSGMVNLTANVAPDDDMAQCITDLQGLAEVAVETHLQSLGERLKVGTQQLVATKAATATANTAATLAEKYSTQKSAF